MKTQEQELRSLLFEQAAQWYVARQADDWSAEQTQEFMHWLRTSALHVSEYLAVSNIAVRTAEAARLDATPLSDLLLGVDAEKSVHWMAGEETNRFAHGVRSHESQVPSRARRTSPGAWRAARWAAACVVLIAAALSAARLGLQDRTAEQRYATTHGERSHLPLPDGTVVDLDAESEISVRYDAAARHISVLRGQAFFEIASDHARPFSVQAGDLQIRDVGTAFNVNRETDGITIAVEHGRVEVYAGSAVAHSVTDKPQASVGAGYQAHFDAAGNAVVSKASWDQLAAWRHDEIAFDDRRLVDVANDFNRYNDTQFVVPDPSIAALRISGTFGVHDTAAFVAFLGMIPGVKTHATGGDAKVIVQADKGTR
jgi:transmembrane sensor